MESSEFGSRQDLNSSPEDKTKGDIHRTHRDYSQSDSLLIEGLPKQHSNDDNKLTEESPIQRVTDDFTLDTIPNRCPVNISFDHDKTGKYTASPTDTQNITADSIVSSLSGSKIDTFVQQLAQTQESKYANIADEVTSQAHRRDGYKISTTSTTDIGFHSAIEISPASRCDSKYNSISEREESPFYEGQNGGNSIGTISTSFILNTSNDSNLVGHNSPNSGPIIANTMDQSSTQINQSDTVHNFTSLYNDHPITIESNGENISDVKTNAGSTHTHTNSSSYQYDETIEPAIEEAVQLLRRDVGTVKTVQLNSYPSLQSLDFQPHEYHIPKKIQNRESNIIPQQLVRSPLLKSPSDRMTKTIQSPSLINKILIPSPTKPKTDRSSSIPVFQNIASPTRFNTTAPINYSPNPSHNGKMTNSEIDLAIDQISNNTLTRNPTTISSSIRNSNLLDDSNQEINPSNYQVKNYNYTEANAEFLDEEKFGMGSGIPIQHLDSNSVASYDSQENSIMDMFSLWRIFEVILICVIIPPLFFMIAIGSRAGISDYRLMKLLLNSEHRIGLLRGFVWYVDMKWFRKLCFYLGTLEVLAIMACIGVGFGVGLTRGG